MGLGPAFLTASIYLTLGRIVVIYGERFSRFLPRTYTVIFVSCDILSLCIQAVGGALTASASDDHARQQGVDVLISGLTLQAFSLALFITLCTEFALRVRKADPSLRNPRFVDLRAMPRFRYFLFGKYLLIHDSITRQYICSGHLIINWLTQLLSHRYCRNRHLHTLYLPGG